MTGGVFFFTLFTHPSSQIQLASQVCAILSFSGSDSVSPWTNIARRLVGKSVGNKADQTIAENL